MEWFEGVGTAILAKIRALAGTVRSALFLVRLMGDRRSYNSAMRLILVRQVYFTAVQVLPLFLGVSLLFGLLVAGSLMATLKSFNLSAMIGQAIIGFIVNELAPFVTVLLVALRSSSAINTEIAVMKVNRELDTLKAYNIDAARYLYLPRLLAGMISIVFLSAFFSFVVVGGSLLIGTLILDWSITWQLSLLIKAVDFGDIAILAFKSATFGLFIAMIPIMSGMAAPREMTAIPISVLGGMVRVFIAIILIEGVSLALKFI